MLLQLISIFDAAIFYIPLGQRGTKTTFNGIQGMLVFFFQYLLIVYYNKEIFNWFSWRDIVSLLNIIVVYELLLGYLQIGMVEIGGGFLDVYKFINYFGILYPGDSLISLKRISLTDSEAAGAGKLLCCFIYPYLFSMIYSQKNKKKYILYALAFLPILFYTKSSTAYILFLFLLCIAFLYFFKHIYFILVTLCILTTLITLLFFMNFAMEHHYNQEENSDKIKYLLWEKPFSKDDYSTICRIMPFYYNWNAFKFSPITGVGNGNQGFFYISSIPDFAWRSTEVQAAASRSQYAIATGSVFCLSLLSGYGIIGVLLLVYYVINCYKTINSLPANQVGPFAMMMKLSWPVIFLDGFETDFYANYYLWFVLSLPYMGNLITGVLDDTSAVPQNSNSRI